MGVPSRPSDYIQRESARLRDENQELKEEVRSLREFVRILNSLYSHKFEGNDELIPFLNDIVLKVMKLLQAPDGSLALLDEESNELVFVIVHGKLSAELTGYRFPANEGIAGWVMQNRKPTLVRNVQTDPHFSNSVDTDFTFHTQSIAAAPLIGDLKVYGLIEVLNQKSDVPFSEEDLALLNLLCRAAGEALADLERSVPPGE